LSRYGAIGAAAVMMMPVARAAPALVWPTGTSAATEVPPRTPARKTGSGRGAFVLLGVMGAGLAFRTMVAPHSVATPEPVLEYRTSVIEGSPVRYSNWGGTRVVLPPSPPAPPARAIEVDENPVVAGGDKVAR
jgi:hypothetical protein